MFSNSTNKNSETFISAPITSVELKNLIDAVETRIPCIIAETIVEKCPRLEILIQDKIIGKLKKSCEKVCKRQSPSILYNKNFEQMAKIDMEKVWLEMKNSHPLLIDVFNAVSGKDDAHDTSKTRYCFIYAILMQLKWHELSLFQRSQHSSSH